MASQDLLFRSEAMRPSVIESPRPTTFSRFPGCARLHQCRSAPAFCTRPGCGKTSAIGWTRLQVKVSPGLGSVAVMVCVSSTPGAAVRTGGGVMVGGWFDEAMKVTLKARVAAAPSGSVTVIAMATIPVL